MKILCYNILTDRQVDDLKKQAVSDYRSDTQSSYDELVDRVVAGVVASVGSQQTLTTLTELVDQLCKFSIDTDELRSRINEVIQSSLSKSYELENRNLTRLMDNTHERLTRVTDQYVQSLQSILKQPYAQQVVIPGVKLTPPEEVEAVVDVPVHPEIVPVELTIAEESSASSSPTRRVDTAGILAAQGSYDEFGDVGERRQRRNDRRTNNQ